MAHSNSGNLTLRKPAIQRARRRSQVGDGFGRGQVRLIDHQRTPFASSTQHAAGSYRHWQVLAGSGPARDGSTWPLKRLQPLALPATGKNREARRRQPARASLEQTITKGE